MKEALYITDLLRRDFKPVLTAERCAYSAGEMKYQAA
jgi:hypothetical protein